ncbi:MAG: T9SS type A sorting domain-containing protein, partial [Chitinophagaceae bacterium]|nr:T9SS type A sorting domain-containing protein [Chitinophagaceae bacterium]
WQRQPIGGAGPFVWENVVGATDTVLSADTLVGYAYRFAVVCSNTNDSIFSASFLIPQLPPHPAVSINPSTTPVTYCLGDSVKFSATFFTGAVYDWMLDSVVIPGWKFNDIGATEPGVYMVRVSSALSPCPGWSNKVTLIVNDPGYSVSITKPSDSIICAGNSMTLTASGSKGGLTYQWRKNNVDIAGATSASYVVTTGGYYRVMAFDGTSTCQAASRNINIIVKPNPPAVLSLPGGTATACENEGVQLNANTGGFSYEWTRGGSTIFGWTDSSQVIKNSGTYAVKVRSVDGCVSVSSSVTVNILPSPTPVITRSGLVLSTTGLYTSYQWVRNGVDIAGEIATNHNLSKNGIFQIRVKDGNGCEGLSNPISIMEQGLTINNTALITEQLKIYPNPTSSVVYIQSPVAVQVSVKDVTGKTIYEARETKEIDLSKYADGIYLFTISDKDGVELIKQQRVTKFSEK